MPFLYHQTFASGICLQGGSGLQHPKCCSVTCPHKKHPGLKEFHKILFEPKLRTVAGKQDLKCPENGSFAPFLYL